MLRYLIASTIHFFNPTQTFYHSTLSMKCLKHPQNEIVFIRYNNLALCVDCWIIYIIYIYNSLCAELTAVQPDFFYTYHDAVIKKICKKVQDNTLDEFQLKF